MRRETSQRERFNALRSLLTHLDPDQLHMHSWGGNPDGPHCLGGWLPHALFFGEDKWTAESSGCPKWRGYSGFNAFATYFNITIKL